MYLCLCLLRQRRKKVLPQKLIKTSHKKPDQLQSKKLSFSAAWSTLWPVDGLSRDITGTIASSRCAPVGMFFDAKVTFVDWEDVVNIAAGRNKSHCPTVLLYTRWAGAPWRACLHRGKSTLGCLRMPTSGLKTPTSAAPSSPRGHASSACDTSDTRARRDS